jgi:hypothetical protein
MQAAEALRFWHQFTLTFLDPSTPLLLIAPDQGAAGPWVDLIAGDPVPSSFFCIKAGTKVIPFTSDIPYTLGPDFISAIDAHLVQCAALPNEAPLPAWPEL